MIEIQNQFRRIPREACMAKKQTTYVVRSTQDGWLVQKEGKKTPESKHKKKDVAFKKGRSLARKAKGILKVKSKTGKIQAKRNYGD
jgi:hypothetical protein